MFGIGTDKQELVTREKAMTGRSDAMEISPTHAVLGTPLQGPWPAGYQVIYFAMGCFWGSERIFWQIPGVYVTAVGYMGGWTPNPNYVEVCTAQTAHTETVQVVYDPSAVSLETLLAAFWENHDATTPNRQGGDIGTQYRSAVYATTADQLAAALESREKYQAKLSDGGFGVISTEILPVAGAGDGTFYYAEDYHQAYLFKNPGGYCNHGFCQVSYA
jgi:peptide-methionine (S)-S-oxide reductase